MNITVQEFVRCVLKSILWIALNLMYGLAPLLSVLYFGSLNLRTDSGEITNEELANLVKSCSILFIFCVVTGAVTIDFLFSRFKMRKGAIALLLGLSIVPLLLICMAYVFLVFDKNDHHTFNNLISLQNWFILYCTLYCVISKTVFFIKEETHHVRSSF